MRARDVKVSFEEANELVAGCPQRVANPVDYRGFAGVVFPDKDVQSGGIQAEEAQMSVLRRP